MKEYPFTSNEVGLMIAMLNDLRKSGLVTVNTWATPEAKSLFYKIQPIADEKEYYLKVVSV